MKGIRKAMKRKRLFAALLGAVLCCVLFLPLGARAEEQEAQLYEKSGAQSMYDSLDGDTRDLLSEAGVGSARIEEEITAERVFEAFSQMLRDKLSGPLKAAAALLAVIILCRLANCFENTEIGTASSLVGALACAAVVVVPLAGLIANAKLVVDSSSVFLLASVPVYSALMIASGSAAAGTSYSLLTLAAGNAIPLLASALILPLLNIFLAFAIASSISSVKFDKLTGSLYNFAKWLLILLVTVFSGVLSVQTMLNSQVDAATNKAAKLIASSAIPIVGSAFGDAIAAIQNSVQIVKSGVGAFGILASLCIFAPAAIEAVLWVAVCTVGQIAGDIFETPKISAFLGTCASVARMILAVIASTCAVAVVCAAVVLFVKGSL